MCIEGIRTFSRGEVSAMRRRVFAVVLVIVLCLAGSLDMARADGGSVRTWGHGTKGSFFRIELTDEGARILVDFRVRTSKPRQQPWRIAMRDDGVIFFRDTRLTNRNGVLNVRHRVADHPGRDRIKVRVHNKVTDEVCIGNAAIEHRSRPLR
jgi:hypothetical protein